MPSDVLLDPRTRSVALVRLRVGLGDLVCSAPALRALRTARPDLHVALVTWPEVGGVVDLVSPYVDELLPFPGADGIPERPPDPAAWPGFVATARSRRFDLALQCYGDRPAANAVTSALGARRVGGFASTGWTPDHDQELHLPYPHDLHEVQRHLRLVAHLGVPLEPHDERPEVQPRPADEVEHAALLARHGLRPGAYAVLHPGASAPSRRWSSQRFAAVGDALVDDGLEVVVTGSPAEAAVTTAVLGAMRRPATDLTGATTLGGLVALLRDAAVLVGNDTGTAHLAAATATPSVTVFLPGDPVRWLHPHPRHRAARVDVGCNPCPHLDCPIDHRCATAVSVEQVLRVSRAVRRPLPAAPPPPAGRRPGGARTSAAP